jgi:hypothetical protein
MINKKYIVPFVFLSVFVLQSSATDRGVFPAPVQQKITEDNPHQWNLNVQGFSPAYYDQQRNAIAINTVEHSPEKWAAATKTFQGKSGVYTIRITSLLETDGESSYVMKIDGKKVMEFKNPRIYGKNIEEYYPHVISVNDIKVKKGSLIQVEFLQTQMD